MCCDWRKCKRSMVELMVGMSSRGLRVDCEVAIDSGVDQRSLKASWRGLQAGKKEAETDGPKSAETFTPPRPEAGVT